MPILAEWWGDWSSLLGLLVGLGGFGVTVFLLIRSKTVAESAREAATRASDRIGRALTLTDVASAIGVVREIMRHQRTGAWETVLDRYTDLKTLLVRIRAEQLDLTADQRWDLQDCITRVSVLAENVEASVGKEIAETDTSRWNRILSEVLEILEILAASCRMSVGELT